MRRKLNGSQENPFAKYVNHSSKVLSIAIRHGWLPGARYTNLRDVRQFDRLGLLDIDWQNYNFKAHLHAARSTRPRLTIARDLCREEDLPRILDEAHEIGQYADDVVIVPKVPEIAERLDDLIPKEFMLGYSVPTSYGQTPIHPRYFRRHVHLLGGRPDVQRRLAESMNVVSFDCNRFTLDAGFGDYFDGEIFRPHPIGGYERCIRDSVININRLWTSYNVNHADRHIPGGRHGKQSSR